MLEMEGVSAVGVGVDKVSAMESSSEGKCWNRGARACGGGWKWKSGWGLGKCLKRSCCAQVVRGSVSRHEAVVRTSARGSADGGERGVWGE